jgi:putative Mn2+ efflux pump MntP
LSNLEIVFLAVALAMDAFSVAASVGPRCCQRLGAIRLAGSFGTFQAVMPILGALVGGYLYVYVRKYDHWVAFGLLEVVGARMLAGGLRPGGEAESGNQDDAFDPSWGWPLLGLSVATSIDAFGAGMGMRMVGANLWLACPLIGVITAALTYTGGAVGVRAERYLGYRAQILGGLVLMGLGIKMLGI